MDIQIRISGSFTRLNSLLFFVYSGSEHTHWFWLQGCTNQNTGWSLPGAQSSLTPEPSLSWKDLEPKQSPWLPTFPATVLARVRSLQPLCSGCRGSLESHGCEAETHGAQAVAAWQLSRNGFSPKHWAQGCWHYIQYYFRDFLLREQSFKNNIKWLKGSCQDMVTRVPCLAP